jgi:glycine/D-amino acid oxidase-like deaminating enzyme
VSSRDSVVLRGSGTTISPWMRALDARVEPLGADVQADVCVIGAGIAGLTTALLLLEAKRSVVVLERDGVAGGETGRTTAHLTFALDDRYHRLVSARGKEVARAAAQSHQDAIRTIETIASAHGIACGLERLEGNLFLPEDGEPEQLRHELRAIDELGIPGVRWSEACPVGDADLGPSLVFGRQAQFHPLQYLSGVAAAIARLGGAIHGRSPVVAVEGEGPFRVVTAAGPAVTARAVVHATNSPLDAPKEIYARTFAYRTYAIAVPIPAGVVPRGLYWDDDAPYHYVRLVAGDRPGEELLVVGGEDHKTGQANDGAARFGNLEAWTKARFPRAGEPRFRWSGQVFETLDGLALIGRYPGKPEGVYVITGDSGMGMTHGTIGGLLVRDLVLGRVHPWESVYDPSRAPLATAMRVVREIAPNAAHTVASTFEKGPECTHRGCTLSWNDVESSWDCPCHGSRFDATGVPIAAPAFAPVTKGMPESAPAARAPEEPASSRRLAP